jgi:hypothetical protein
LLHREGLTVVHGPVAGEVAVDEAGERTLANEEPGLWDAREVAVLGGGSASRLAVRFGWPGERTVVGWYEGESSVASALWVSEEYGGESGLTSLSTGEVDGDGLEDLVVRGGSNEPGPWSGRVYVLLQAGL